MDELSVGPYDEMIAEGEVQGVNAAEAADILAEVRADLLADVVDNADVYTRPRGYPKRPRSGPVVDEAVGSAPR